MYVASAPRRGPGGRLALIATATAVGAGAAAVPGAAGVAYGTAPGDGTDVRIHATTTGFTEPRDETKVCRFYLAAFAAGPAPASAVQEPDGTRKIAWTVEPLPGTSSAAVSGEITLTAGTGHTGPLSLPNGEHQVTWSSAGQSGVTEHQPSKTFKVSCPERGAPPGGSGGFGRSMPMVRDVFGNLVPAGGAETGTGSSAAATDRVQTATGIAVALGAIVVGGRFLRRDGRGGTCPRSR